MASKNSRVAYGSIPANDNLHNYGTMDLEVNGCEGVPQVCILVHDRRNNFSGRWTWRRYEIVMALMQTRRTVSLLRQRVGRQKLARLAEETQIEVL